MRSEYGWHETRKPESSSAVMQSNWRSYAGLSGRPMKRSFENAHGWRRRREFRVPGDVDSLRFQFDSGGGGWHGWETGPVLV